MDWRSNYHNLGYSRIDVPEPVARGVVDYCCAMGLVYGAFDFVVRPDGTWVFLECNAGGQHGWIEDAFTPIDPDPWTALVPWFLAQIGHPPITGYGRRGPGVSTTVISAADGSWCEIGATRPDGRRAARSGGPRALWADLEQGHAEWARLDRPGWERLGLTITPNGEHLLWCDRPDHFVKTVSTPEQTLPGL